jgi:hypothetical protein
LWDELTNIKKTDPKPLLVRPNPDPNKLWILAENKVLINLKQAMGCR